MSRLDEIRVREEKASKGPWVHYSGQLRKQYSAPINEVQLADGKAVVKWSGFDGVDLSPGKVRNNASFIAHAREDIPYLLSLIADKSEIPG